MISIVMPVYNAEKYLRTSIGSVLKQSYPDFELIAVNDGSTDQSFQILKDCSEEDKRVRVIDQANAGPSKARNAGIDAARGEWLYFMDADDWIEQDMLESVLRDSAGADVVIFGREKHIEGRHPRRGKAVLIPETVSSDQEMGVFLTGLLKKAYKDCYFNYIWNRLISVSVIRQNKIRFDETIKLGEDFLFNTQLLKATPRIKVMDKCLYHYYVRGKSSLVSRFYPDELQRRKLMYASMKSLYQHYHVYESCRADLELREGRNTQFAITKINYPTCPLDAQGKIRYLDGFLKDERRDFLLQYLSRLKGKKMALERVLVRIGNPLFLLWFMERSFEKE
ncbi:MAG: glycosyltransferase family 2 protein [Blautia sp.]|nr:glycosyltransferase family 2 protein [Blautia sp.]